MAEQEPKSIELHFPDAKPLPFNFDDGPIYFKNSSTITWAFSGGKSVRADLITSLSNPHRHYNNIKPVSKSLTPDYKNYTTGINISFIPGSLKVYINGVRLLPHPMRPIYVPSPDPLNAWNLNGFTENATGLGFSLLHPITSDDTILIDFEVTL